MALIRAFEERCMELKTAGEIPGSIHLCSGQEAIPVGACRALEARDALTTTYRGHGWAISRGVPLDAIFAELLGRNSALCGGRGGSPYFSSSERGFLGENSIVGAGVPIALGAALAAVHDLSGAVSLVSIGEGALAQGSVHEALNFGAAFSLPLVVIVENNRYTEMTPISSMVRSEPLSRRAEAYDIPGITIDGNDVSTVEEATNRAVAHARGGGGPYLIEAMTERLVGHYSGDAQHYRPAGEIASAREREPLVRIRKAAAAREDSTTKRLDEIDQMVALAVDEALSRARDVPFPDPSTALEHLYA